jgi:hypothetical protein
VFYLRGNIGPVTAAAGARPESPTAAAKGKK